MAEVHRDTPIRQNVSDKIAGNLLGHSQIPNRLGMREAHDKAVQPPGLSPGPAGALGVPLSTIVPCKGPGIRVKLHNVPDAAVLPDKIPGHSVGVDLGDFPEPGGSGLLTGPIEQGDVEHTVDDGSAPSVAVLTGNVVPGADESSGIEAACQKIGGVEAPAAGCFFMGHAVVRHSAGKIHKSHIVVQT